MSTARLLVLAIDAANPVLIERWAAEGRLPALRNLTGRGLQGPTRSVEGFFVGSTWPSFQTGINPARHGLHYLAQIEPGTYRYRSMGESGFVRGETFWNRLSRAGKRVAVLDVPLTRVESLRNGMQVVEWGSHDAVFGFHASPAALESEIASRFGDHPLTASCDGVARTQSGYAAFLDRLERGVRTKAALTRHYLRAGEWDFFMQVFTEAHCAGHQCWHLHDPAHPSHDAAMAAAIGDPLLRIYRAVDDAIAGIIDDAGDALVVVLVGHGMAHAFGAAALLHDMLFRLGVSAPPEPAMRGRTSSVAWRGARAVWRALPPGVRRGLSPLRSAMLAMPPAGLPSLRVDAPASRCFPVHNGLATAGIRFNLAGREPRGILPASEAETFCRELSEALLSFVDDETGDPVVARVTRTADMYEGEHLADLPDLLVEWTDSRRLGNTELAGGAGALIRIRSPATGLIEGVNDYGRTGEHRIGGMFIASGPGIAPGRLDTRTSIMDFAPTFCARLGVEATGYDGRTIRALVDH